MNIHRLELFYYVAKHGGISAAVRHMPYGIQQPALSSQILHLEEDLGAKLFVRQPFKLTPEGEEMLEFVRPFFENLGPMAVRFRRSLGPQLRLGTPAARPPARRGRTVEAGLAGTGSLGARARD